MRTESNSSERFLLKSGLVFATLQIVSILWFSIFVLSKKPPVSADAIEHAAFYMNSGNILLVGNYLLAVPVPFFLLLLGGFYTYLRRIESGSGSFAVSSVLSGTAMIMLWPLGGILTNTGIIMASEGGNAATIWGLDAMGPYTLALSALPRAVLLFSSSMILLRTRVTPAWVIWFGLSLAVMCLVGSAMLVYSELFPLLGLGSFLFLIWLLITVVYILRKPALMGSR
jgi:hypothetical protein